MTEKMTRSTLETKNDTSSNEKLNQNDASLSKENLNNHDTTNDTFHNGNKNKHDTSSSEKLTEHYAPSEGNLNSHETKMTLSIMEI